jgi:acetyl-CoA synthetase
MHDTNLLEDQPIAWTPTPEVIERAQLTKFMRQVGVSTWDELYEFSIRDVEKFTEEVLKFLDIKFDPPYEKLLDTTNGIEFPKWFGTRTPSSATDAASAFEEGSASGLIADEGVRVPTAGLNITTMCLDRWQTDEMKDQPAVIAENESGQVWEYSYSTLFEAVTECGQALELIGLGKGDAVGIHLPMIVETVVALLAINRIGAIAVPVFSGYGVEAIASRMNAVGAKALFTCDGFSRRSKFISAAETAIEAMKSVPTIKHLISVRTDLTVLTKLNEIGDRLDYEPFLSTGHNSLLASPEKAQAEPTSAEDPLIILYTSGTTGKPKGIAHTHASFPIKAAQDMAFGTDVGRGTRICWYTDIGWMMGPWLIYGALINGATICIYDGAPDYPTPDRMWEFCAKHKVEVLGISPTLIRSLSNCGDDLPKKHDLSSFRAFASTGEPWNPAPWWWLFEKVGNSKLPIINYSGGTEIAGGILMGNPLLPQKPCSFPAPCPGMDVDILDEEGNPVGPNQVGELVIKQPWIGMARGFWQEKERYLETYWRRFKNIWVHGDWAMRDEDGHWFILGRSDDTLKVAGKRVGPAEVESLLVAHPLVTEAAVIGVPDEKKGTAMVAFCVLRNADAPVRNEPEGRKGWHRRGYLPHFDGDKIQFVTFRLADSLPRQLLDQLKQEIENNKLPDPSGEYGKKIEEYLDSGRGECILARPEIASIVQETLLHDDGDKYDLFAWAIMPNHVHVALRPKPDHSLSGIMKTIKGVTSHKINKVLGRSGPLWQPDYFDRYIRDEKHFHKTVQYIEINPVKAGLCSKPEDWPFSSGGSGSALIADEGVRVPSVDELKALVAKDMGKPLAPSKIHFVSALPKTRNAKVMRRVLRAAYLGENPGDLSALENPQTVDEIAGLGAKNR